MFVSKVLIHWSLGGGDVSFEREMGKGRSGETYSESSRIPLIMFW